MYALSFSLEFNRDVKACMKKHWDIDALKKAIEDLQRSDEVALGARYKNHALAGSLQGYYAIHVDSAPHPPKDQWVLMYKVSDSELSLVRTGTHDEVHGK